MKKLICFAVVSLILAILFTGCEEIEEIQEAAEDYLSVFQAVGSV